MFRKADLRDDFVEVNPEEKFTVDDNYITKNPATTKSNTHKQFLSQTEPDKQIEQIVIDIDEEDDDDEKQVY